jgi:hypothetical protein
VGVLELTNVSGFMGDIILEDSSIKNETSAPIYVVVSGVPQMLARVVTRG